MGCNCIDEMNTAIASKNTRLSLAFRMSGPASLIIETELIEKKRGAKPLMAIPTFCPFCGVKYEVAS